MNRIVTGPAANGRATIIRSDTLVPSAALPGSLNEIRLCWATSGPLSLPYDCVDPITKIWTAFPNPGETRFLLLTFMPNSNSPMHATPTTDYVVVVAGELWLIMEDGKERKLLTGDSVVQNGTMHAWQNRSSEPCTIAATMIGAHSRASTSETTRYHGKSVDF